VVGRLPGEEGGAQKMLLGVERGRGRVVLRGRERGEVRGVRMRGDRYVVRRRSFIFAVVKEIRRGSDR